MILVTGATGKVGRELILELKIRKLPFKVLARDAAKARALLGPVDCVPGDFNVPETLEKAMAGAHAAFLLSPADPRMVAWQTAFARAAKKAGVKRLVKVSAIVADAKSPIALGRWHGEIEEEIKRLDISFVMLQPAYFYQNFLGLAPLILRGVLPGPMGTSRFAMVDARDVAAAAAAALATPAHDG
ncbi:MAG: NAD(P)H-binding protein, partial [Elusimicrobiota bacterium]